MEVIRCKFFMISKPTKKHWYFFLFIFGAIFRILIPDLIKKLNGGYNNDDNEDKDASNTTNNDPSLETLLTEKYIEIIGNLLSALLMGFPHFFYKIINKVARKKNKQEYNSNIQKIRFIYNEEKSIIPNMLKIIFVISTVDVICQLAIPLKYIFEEKVYPPIIHIDSYHLYFLLFFDIFARYIFSRIILKTFFYLHHKLSFLLNIIGLIPIAIVDFSSKFNREKDQKHYDIIFVLVLSVQLILYSFEDIMNKVAFRALSILPCTLIFYNGLFQLCYFILISAFFFKFDLYDFSTFEFKKVIQYFIGFLPFNIIRNLYLVKVIDKFSAQHMALLKISESASIYLYSKIAETFNLRDPLFELEFWQYAIQGIGFTFLIISSLIHNELIIIDQPKLKAKTEYYLDKDAYREQNSSFNSDSLFSTSKDSGSNFDESLTGSDYS